MATIIQDYGPIYGEVVNGTVQGRPNGSVYVPISNTVSYLLEPEYIKKFDSSIETTNAIGTRWAGNKLKVNAIAQDLASNLRVMLYSDAELTTVVGSGRNFAAGIFDVEMFSIGGAGDSTLTPGETYYLKASLINNGVEVASAGVLEVIAV